MINNVSRRTGAVLPLIAVFIAAFMFVAALTINSNWFMFNHTNAQNTADICARASLQTILDDTSSNGRFERARDLGTRLYDLNFARNVSSFDADRIRFGNVLDASVDDPEFIETLDEDNVVSAVHVDSPVQLEQQQVEVFFSKLLGSDPKIKIFADAKASTQPLDIFLCLDASRSMNLTPNSPNTLSRAVFPPGATDMNEPPFPGSRWDGLTETVELFLNEMLEKNPNARIGLVTFGGGGNPRGNISSPLDADLSRFEVGLTIAAADGVKKINDVLESYVTDYPALAWGTSLYDGLTTATKSFLKDNNSSKHIIMLSDGSQAGVTRPNPLIAARSAANKDITVHTVAFGGGERSMRDIAVMGGGETFFAASELELKEAFGSLLSRFRVQLVD